MLNQLPFLFLFQPLDCFGELTEGLCDVSAPLVCSQCSYFSFLLESQIHQKEWVLLLLLWRFCSTDGSVSWTPGCWVNWSKTWTDANGPTLTELWLFEFCSSNTLIIVQTTLQLMRQVFDAAMWWIFQICGLLFSIMPPIFCVFNKNWCVVCQIVLWGICNDDKVVLHLTFLTWILHKALSASLLSTFTMVWMMWIQHLCEPCFWMMSSKQTLCSEDWCGHEKQCPTQHEDLELLALLCWGSCQFLCWFLDEPKHCPWLCPESTINCFPWDDCLVCDSVKPNMCHECCLSNAFLWKLPVQFEQLWEVNQWTVCCQHCQCKRQLEAKHTFVVQALWLMSHGFTRVEIAEKIGFRCGGLNGLSPWNRQSSSVILGSVNEDWKTCLASIQTVFTCDPLCSNVTSSTWCCMSLGKLHHIHSWLGKFSWLTHNLLSNDDGFSFQLSVALECQSTVVSWAESAALVSCEQHNDVQWLFCVLSKRRVGCFLPIWPLVKNFMHFSGWHWILSGWVWFFQSQTRMSESSPWQESHHNDHHFLQNFIANLMHHLQITVVVQFLCMLLLWLAWNIDCWAWENASIWWNEGLNCNAVLQMNRFMDCSALFAHLSWTLWVVFWCCVWPLVLLNALWLQWGQVNMIWANVKIHGKQGFDNDLFSWQLLAFLWVRKCNIISHQDDTVTWHTQQHLTDGPTIDTSLHDQCTNAFTHMCEPNHKSNGKTKSTENQPLSLNHLIDSLACNPVGSDNWHHLFLSDASSWSTQHWLSSPMLLTTSLPLCINAAVDVPVLEKGPRIVASTRTTTCFILTEQWWWNS